MSHHRRFLRTVKDILFGSKPVRRWCRRERPASSQAETLESRLLLTNFLVNTTANIAGDGLVSLREAVLAANANAAIGDAPAGDAHGDRITFDPSLAGETIAVGGAELLITDDLVIDGGSLDITLDAQDVSRVFHIDTAQTVTLANLTLIRGRAPEEGGAIRTTGGGTTNLHALMVTDSHSLLDGGGLAGTGGGVINITDSEFARNHADFFVGGILQTGGTLNLHRTIISQNTSGEEIGGLHIKSGANAAIVDSTIEENSAGIHAGGITVSGSSNVTIDGSSIARNIAGFSGGGFWSSGGSTVEIRNSRITDNQASGEGGGGGILVMSGGHLTISDDTQITGNSVANSPGTGGGILIKDGAVEIRDSTVSDNNAMNSGGGLFNSANGKVTIDNTMILNNSVQNTDPAAEVFGGGVFNDGGTINIASSTLSNNSIGGSGVIQGDGGGLASHAGRVLIWDSTISANSADGHGGGLSIGLDTIADIFRTTITENEAIGSGSGVHSDRAEVNVVDSTITRNSTINAGGGIFNQFGTLLVSNTVLAENIAARGGGFSDHFGTVSVFDSEVVENSASQFGGGIHSTGGSVFIVDSLIRENTARFDGGAFLNSWDGEIVLESSVVSGNTAEGNGGGIYNDGHFTYDADSSITGNSATIGGGIYTDTNGILEFEDPSVVHSNSPENYGGPDPYYTDLSGWWIFNGGGAQVLQYEGTIKFINEHGGTSDGYFVTPTQVVATDWGHLVGNIVDNQIRWENLTVWSDLPDLPPNHRIDSNSPTLVEQLGTELRFTNEFGHTSNGRFLNEHQVIAVDWGNLTATVVGDNLEWENGTVWTGTSDPASGEPVNVSGTWSNNGLETRILQFDTFLVFVNEFGGVSQGTLDGDTSLTATDWGITGTIDAATGSIAWSNGSVWNRVPVLDRNENWHMSDSMLPTTISQLGNRFVFTNEHGDRSEGRYDPATGSIIAELWGDQGNLSGEIDYTGGEIGWANSSRWNNSDFGALDEVFADTNLYPWIV